MTAELGKEGFSELPSIPAEPKTWIGCLALLKFEFCWIEPGIDEGGPEAGAEEEFSIFSLEISDFSGESTILNEGEGVSLSRFASLELEKGFESFRIGFVS